MAAFIRGLTAAEMMALTKAFVDSGRKLQFERSDPPRVDKHSTGGVGDKTSLVVAPLVASAGLLVPRISSGQAMETFRKMVEAQGGDVSAINSPPLLLGQPAQSIVQAPAGGALAGVRADLLGRAALRLGAGREQASDQIDPQAGILVHAKIGNSVKKGDPLATLYYNRQSSLEDALELASRAFQISSEPVEQPKLIQMVVH